MALFLLVASMLLSGEHDTPVVRPDPQQWYARNACIECHRQAGGRLAEIVDQEWAKSVHYENNVPCEQCHGGDATLLREDFATEEEYKAASHLTFHPEFLFLRDRKGIGKAPETTISFACRECHDEDGKTRVGDPHRGGDAAACLFWRDGGVSSTRGRSIAYTCARCHPRATEKHLGSAHGNFGVPSCLFCHGAGSHAMPAATAEIIDTRPREELGRCAPCHTTGNMEVVALVRKMREETAGRIETCRAQFDELVRMGYRNLALTEMHNHIDNILKNLREVLHGTDLREITELTKSIENVAKQTAYDYELVNALHEARRGQTEVALGVAGLLLVLAAMIVLYRRAFCGPADRSTEPPLRSG
jgi:hypothetical protein